MEVARAVSAADIGTFEDLLDTTESNTALLFGRLHERQDRLVCSLVSRERPMTQIL